MLRRWLARLVSAEVRHLTEQRNTAARAAVRWHQTALIEQARADALAQTKEQ
ncbi:hypothetical protein [Micromonospora sp. NPDC047730]|uniref:hypothetical protein n=1 Tax=Micromonospora sp. NPDC047730 TaxID=3364253 RepID=UPI00371E0D5B